MTKKILQLITELNPGGAEQMVLDLVRTLDTERYTPIVAALDGRGEIAGRICDLGVEVIDLEAYSRYDCRVIWRLRKILLELNIDLLHTHLIHATVVGRLAARPLGIPVVSTSHIVDRRPVWWHFWLDRLTSPFCRKEICVSKAVMDFQVMKTGLSPDFFSVIHNGIDFDRFAAASDHKADNRKELGLGGDIVVGALGRFDRQKGFDVYLEAIAEYYRQPQYNDSVIFVLAGYGSEEGALRRLAEELGINDRVRFLDYQPEPERFLSSLDICVMPSRWEGFGLVATEAMACGAAVVASNVDSLPEILSDGFNGFLVESENHFEFATTIARLVADEDLRLRISKEAVIASGKFSLEKMAGSYDDIYSGILL